MFTSETITILVKAKNEALFAMFLNGMNKSHKISGNRKQSKFEIETFSSQDRVLIEQFAEELERKY